MGHFDGCLDSMSTLSNRAAHRRCLATVPIKSFDRIILARSYSMKAKCRSMRIRLAGMAVVLIVTACAPSLESKSAGSIGCLPSEVQISDEDSSTGWGSSSDTWVASCRGRRFICSENTIATASGNGASGVSQNLACRELLGDSSSPPGEGGTVKPVEGDGSTARKQSPTGAAGFGFWATPSEIKKACEDAGKTWTSDSSDVGTCSGPAADVGFDATVRIAFCRNRSCVIDLEHRPESNWLSVFDDLKRKLAQKYGTPVSIPATGIPDKCRKEEQFAKCLEVDGMRQKYRWGWPNRQQVVLTVGRPEDEPGPVAIRINYVASPRPSLAKADAL